MSATSAKASSSPHRHSSRTFTNTFTTGILSFFYIYATFEEEWSRLLANPPPSLPPRKLHILRTLYSPIFLRTEPLLQDLAFYFSLPNIAAAQSQFSIPSTPGRRAYAQHIRDAIAKEPLVIISYAHNMYLALFAGGKIIKSKMLSTVGFFPRIEGHTSEESQRLGTNMFAWDVEKGREEELVRGAFKRKLAEIEDEITEEEKTEVIRESREIFVQNAKLIEELDRLTRERNGDSRLMTWFGVMLMALASFLAFRVCAAAFPGLVAPLMVLFK